MTDDADSVRMHADRARAAGAVVRAQSLEARASWLSESAARLGPSKALGEEAREVLLKSTGLSGAMIDWCLRTTLQTVEREALVRLGEAARAEAGDDVEPLSLLSLVLAGNVFTTPVRAVVVPLLLGAPVLAKTSSKETHFAWLLCRALRSANEELGEALQVVAFGRDERGPQRALVEHAAAVGVYGGDDAVAAVGALAARAVPVVAHGHGLSTAFVSRIAATATEAARQLAIDVAAYDQRGCLSPSVVYVEGDRDEAERFAASLSAELEAVERRLPRGPLPDAVAAAQVQWRGLAAVDGTLLRGTTHSVAVQPLGPPRWSPGYRNVAVVPVGGLEDAVESMATFSSHLKCVGCDETNLTELASALRAYSTFHAYVTPVGTMQTPALDAPQDGHPIWQGLLEKRGQSRFPKGQDPKR